MSTRTGIRKAFSFKRPKRATPEETAIMLPKLKLIKAKHAGQQASQPTKVTVAEDAETIVKEAEESVTTSEAADQEARLMRHAEDLIQDAERVMGQAHASWLLAQQYAFVAREGILMLKEAEESDTTSVAADQEARLMRHAEDLIQDAERVMEQAHASWLLAQQYASVAREGILEAEMCLELLRELELFRFLRRL